MTMAQVSELFDYWHQSPPTHELAAAYLRYKPSRRRPSAPLPNGAGPRQTEDTPLDFSVLAGMAPGGGPVSMAKLAEQ